MSEEEIMNRLAKAKERYYRGLPTLPDVEYDKLEEKLRSINPNNPILSFVGTDMDGDVIHDPPMLSCKKFKNISQVEKWGKGKELVYGYKVDGVSLSLQYVSGRLVTASTRGDGKKGVNVTQHIYMSDNIPKKIENTNQIEIRGEAYIPLYLFYGIYDEQGYNSPRNLVAGLLNSNDPSVCSDIHFLAWGLYYKGKMVSPRTAIEKVEKLGFYSADIGVTEDKHIEDVYRNIEKRRPDLEFEIDGVMYKFSSLKDIAEVGETDHHPRWSCTLKFESDVAITTIKKIIWRPGRTGVYTPIAIIDPVYIAGATIERISLHNAAYVIDNGIGVGSEVEVIRSGDIIPKINKVITQSETKVPDRNCLHCDTKLVFDGVYLRCSNQDCKIKKIRHMEYYVKVVGIENLGNKRIIVMWNSGYKSITSMFEITKDRLYGLFGKNGYKIHDEIQKARYQSYETFLTSLGISSLSRSTARKISQKVGKNFVVDFSYSFLKNIEGIGDKKAKTITTRMKNNKRVEELFNLVEAGIIIITDKNVYEEIDDYEEQVEEEKEVKKTGVLTGKSVYVTGSHSKYKKNELKEIVERHGGEWKGISKKLSLLVVGKNPGQVKIDKATDYGIKMISLEKFLEKLGID